MRNPYILPSGKIQISFSGGRTSAYMLHQIVEANGGLSDRCEIVFANTGREMPQTLDFVHEVSQRWQVPITWVEWRQEGGFEIVGYQGAAREGEPFKALIEKKGYLPNALSRYCTSELKVRAARDYLRSIGWEHWTAAIGIRADEPHRTGKPPLKERWQRWTPLVDANVSRHDVSDFWKAQPFDLQLPNVNGRCALGNCDGCFLKSEAHLAMLAREYPERHAWWEQMESLTEKTASNPDGARFSVAFSRKQLGSFVDRQGDWIFDTEGALCQADGGDCLDDAA